MAGKGDGIYVWAGAGTDGGDEHKKTGEKSLGIPIGTIGFNNDGASTANVYIWTGVIWADTTQTVAGFFGV